MSTNDIAVNKVGIGGVTGSGLVGRVTFIFRGAGLFGASLLRGVGCNGPTTDSRTIRHTVSLSRDQRVVSQLPGKLGAGVKMSKAFLSKKRRRHVILTQTVLGSTPVIILSRTATFTSPRGRRLVRGTLRRLEGKGAILVVTRRLADMRSTSGVLIVTRNGVTRRNARDRLVTQGNVCGDV